MVVFYLIMYPFMFFIWMGSLTAGRVLGHQAEKIQSFEDHLGVQFNGKIFFVSCGAAAIFGAIHCAAWGLTFSSSRDQLLWEISSLIVAGTPILCIIFYTLWKYTTVLDFGFGYAVMGLFILLGAVSYPVARLTLIILSFMTLQNLPYRALETVEWTTFIPHI
jgi:hypothetical protein